MPKVPQEEYNRVIRTIAENSSYRFKRRDSESGAFLIPTNGHDHPVGDVFHVTWPKLKKLADLLVEGQGFLNDTWR